MKDIAADTALAPELNDALGHWLAGLVAGEGCFTLFTRRRRLGRSDDCRVISFTFKIALRADDLGALELARATLGGVGHISPQGKNRHAESRGRIYRGNPLLALVVNDRAQLCSVVSFFRTYPIRSKKRRDFELWAEALERFRDLTLAAPLVWFSKGKEVHVSRIGPRRPVKGATRQRFRKIPDDVFIEMQRYELALKDVRRFPASAAGAST